MNRNICVYSSSSCAIDRKYFEAAEELGRMIAQRGDTLLYGAGMTGLMGAMATSAKNCGGRITGVIPDVLNQKGIVYEGCNELIITGDLRERKALLDSKADAFIAMPGGFGTMEELMEIITLKQLKYHEKPIVIMNIGDYYRKLLDHFGTVIDERFARAECTELYYVVSNATEALDYIDTYKPPCFSERWLTHTGTHTAEPEI